jgi:serine/threonine protein kinase
MSSGLDNLTKEEKIKLLSQGSYGCVFRPTLNCNGNIGSKRYVSKIQNNSVNSQKETAIGEVIKKIKNFSLHFAPIVKTCPVSLGKLKDDEISKCEIVDMKYKTAKNAYVTNKIRYVGKYTLGDYLFHVFQTSPKLFLRTFMDSYFDILQSVSILNKHNILHLDLKENNILYDEKNSKPILIDFGLSVNITGLKPENYQKAFFTYGYDYPPWCFEISLISYAVNELGEDWATQTTSIDVFDKLCLNFINQNPFFEEKPEQIVYFTAEEKALYKTKLSEYLKPYDGKTWLELVDELLKFLPTWDIYGIHVIYLYLIHKIYPDERDFSAYPSLQRFIGILKREITVTPNQRKPYEAISEETMSVLKTTKRKETYNVIEASVFKSKKVDNIKNIQQNLAKLKLEEMTKEADMYGKLKEVSK